MPAQSSSRRTWPRLTNPADVVRWAQLLVARLGEQSDPRGPVVRSPDGLVTKRLGIDNSGNITVSDVA